MTHSTHRSVRNKIQELILASKLWYWTDKIQVYCTWTSQSCLTQAHSLLIQGPIPLLRLSFLHNPKLSNENSTSLHQAATQAELVRIYDTLTSSHSASEYQ